jgi:hypothetical protein
MNCEYCSSPDAKIYTDDIYVCDKCQTLLSVPSDARRLLHGHICLKLRGTIPEHELSDLINNLISEWEKWEIQSRKIH